MGPEPHPCSHIITRAELAKSTERRAHGRAVPLPCVLGCGTNGGTETSWLPWAQAIRAKKYSEANRKQTNGSQKIMCTTAQWLPGPEPFATRREMFSKFFRVQWGESQTAARLAGRGSRSQSSSFTCRNGQRLHVHILLASPENLCSIPPAEVTGRHGKGFVTAGNQHR